MNETTQTYGVYQFGNADALTNISQTLSHLGAEDVRIKVISSSVNPIDVKTRMGLGFVAKNKAPEAFMALGYDVFGVVENVGKNVSDVQVGQHIIAMAGFAHSPGCYSTHVHANQSELIVVGAQENPRIAGLCLAGLTAWQALQKLMHHKDKPLFINASTGGVGHLAIQIAKMLDFDVVALSARASHQLLQALDVSVMSYDTFYDSAQHNCSLLDLVGGECGLQLLEHIKKGNSVVTVPTLSKDVMCTKAESLGINASGIVVSANRADLKALYSAYQTGEIRVHEDKTFCLDDISGAHSYMEQGNYCGKIIITA
ncbi:NADP-dependent oxidoreductase [Pseudoalteromonas aurantia]|uniref:NADPH2:quinone reductase n=1 Tax=Pseudoalteromonas aurantia 208 TaxID=1314867 RepID=A0ABR9E8H5_9GAMM|nr:NADP-dependent oxidoreductase [Pseudoalteromonas aurantia]MBE0367291.1 NADPH2:quinone reductase [Pseudoalteromonas aurantia 208]